MHLWNFGRFCFESTDEKDTFGFFWMLFFYCEFVFCCCFFTAHVVDTQREKGMRMERIIQPIASSEPPEKNKKMFIKYPSGLVHVYVTVVRVGEL